MTTFVPGKSFAIFSQATSPLCPGGMEMSMSRMSGLSRETIV